MLDHYIRRHDIGIKTNNVIKAIVIPIIYYILIIAAAKNVDIVAVIIFQDIVAGATVQDVVAFIADERIMTRTAIEDVIAFIAAKTIVTSTTVDDVIIDGGSQVICFIGSCYLNGNFMRTDSSHIVPSLNSTRSI
jgi:hypothetical protein